MPSPAHRSNDHSIGLQSTQGRTLGSRQRRSKDRLSYRSALFRAGALPIHIEDSVSSSATGTTSGRIIDRVLVAPGLFKYNVITDTGVDLMVDIEQISNYVSPMKLEEFETQEFELELRKLQQHRRHRHDKQHLPQRDSEISIHSFHHHSEDELDDDEQDDDDDSMSLASDEYIVEKILGHALSDPRTHSTSLGRQPVMLYHVKWEGYETTTWEPRSHFAEDLITEYEQQAGIQTQQPLQPL